MKYKDIIVDATSYTLAGYLVQPLSIISSLFVKGSIGPYLAGVFGTLNLFVFYASFSHFGILNAAERDLPFCLGNGDQERFNRIGSTAFVSTLISSCICACGVVIWALLSRPSIDKHLFIGSLVFAVYIIIWSWSAYYLTLLRTYQKFVFLSKVQVIIGITSALGSIVCVALFNFWGLLAITVINILFQAILFTKKAGRIPKLKIDGNEFKKLLVVGIPLVLFGLTMTGMKTVDNILVLRLLGTEQLGVYSIAYLANSAIFQVTNSLSGVLYPRMQKGYGETSTINNLSRFVVRPSIIMGVLLPVLIAALFFFIPPTVIWFLPRYRGGLSALKVVSISAYFLAMFPQASNFLIALNKQIKVALFMVGGIGLSIISGLITTHLGWGLVGIALATGLGYLFCFLSINGYALKHFMDFKKSLGFFLNLVVPIAYAAGFLFLIDLLIDTKMDNMLLAFGTAAVKYAVFVLAYIPIAFWMEPKCGLIKDIIRPIIGRLIRPKPAF